MEEQKTVVQPETGVQVSPSSSQVPPEEKVVQPKISQPKSKKILIILGIVILLGVLFFGNLLRQGLSEGPQVKETVDAFMASISNRDYDTAYGLISTEFKETFPREQFDETWGKYDAQFSGFREQKQTGFTVNSSTNGSTYNYKGEVTYDNGDKGDLEALLKQENGVWKIVSVEVFVDDAREQRFQNSVEDYKYMEYSGDSL